MYPSLSRLLSGVFGAFSLFQTAGVDAAMEAAIEPEESIFSKRVNIFHAAEPPASLRGEGRPCGAPCAASGAEPVGSQSAPMPRSRATLLLTSWHSFRSEGTLGVGIPYFTRFCRDGDGARRLSPFLKWKIHWERKNNMS